MVKQIKYTEQILVRFDPEMLRKAKTKASKLNLSLSSFIRRAVAEYTAKKFKGEDIFY